MGLIISIIVKTIIGILGAGYCIELSKKMLNEYNDGVPIRKIAPIAAAVGISLYIVIWLNHDYIYSMWNGIYYVGKYAECELMNCNPIKYADNDAKVGEPLGPQEPQSKPSAYKPPPIESDRPTQPTSPQGPVAPIYPQKTPETGRGPSFDCSNIFSSVESAICGDPELSRLDRLTAEAYHQLEDNPATSHSAFDVKMDLVRGRAACIKWKPGEPYRTCIQQQQLSALRAYHDLGSSVALQ